MPTPNTTFVSGAILTAAQQNNFGFSTMALTKNTTLLQSGVTTVVDLTGMTATFTAVANRNYKVSFGMYGIPTVTNACFQVNLQNGATILQTTITNGGIGAVGTTMSGFFVGTFSAGSTTLKLTGLLAPSSTGTITFNAAATLPVYIHVEDVGPI